MRFYQVSTVQLIIASILVGFIAGGINVVNNEYQHYKLLPVVEQSSDGKCVQVLNFENGHAFNCNDVNVVLRQYRTLQTEGSLGTQ